MSVSSHSLLFCFSFFLFLSPQFLPNIKALLIEYTQLECRGQTNTPRYAELSKLIRKCEELHEDNGMLGHRGVRLGKFVHKKIVGRMGEITESIDWLID